PKNEIALILVGLEQRGHRIPKVFRSPARVAKLRCDANVSELELHAAAEDESDVVVLVKLRRSDRDVDRVESRAHLIHAADVPEVGAGINKRPRGSSPD